MAGLFAFDGFRLLRLEKSYSANEGTFEIKDLESFEKMGLGRSKGSG
ncbi:hypothetical protein GCWU000342_00068 [Shuttleworthella satelles DSM 14600]|uniref:Uncharacterized protein n=1 Tax=Shuttleworthella satelles DSM 14600 TaxID=626523 RepID=C4G8A6_9FIRM|nr:hypothetical protein GCWU000342_00068 [Shuttleworthia satelles DSM 14600]